jgi:hypothetical protein
MQAQHGARAPWCAARRCHRGRCFRASTTLTSCGTAQHVWEHCCVRWKEQGRGRGLSRHRAQWQNRAESEQMANPCKWTERQAQSKREGLTRALLSLISHGRGGRDVDTRRYNCRRQAFDAICPVRSSSQGRWHAKSCRGECWQCQNLRRRVTIVTMSIGSLAEVLQMMKEICPTL